MAPRLVAGVLAACVVAGGGTWAAAAAPGSPFGPAAVASAAQFTELSVTAPPARTAYVIGSLLDTSGLVITGRTADGVSRELSGSEYTLTGFESDAPGTKTITVALSSDPGVRTSFDVTVDDVQLPTADLLNNGSFQSGALSPWTADYAVGSPDVVSGSRTNGVSAENGQDGNAGYSFWDRNAKTEASVSQTLADLPRGYYTVSGYGTGNTGDAVSTISVPETDWSAQFDLNGGGNWQQKSHSFAWPGGDLTVQFGVKMLKTGGWVAFDNFSLVRTAPDEHIAGIVASSVKTEYTVGDELDLSSIRVRKVMDDDTTFSLDADAWTASGFDGSVEGTQTVTVALRADSTKTATFDVDVQKRQAQPDDITALKITERPWRTVYKVGRPFDGNGMRITGTDAQGDKRVLLPSEYRIVGFDPTTPGTQKVSIVMRHDSSVSARLNVHVVERPASGIYRIGSLNSSTKDGVVTVRDGKVTVDLGEVPSGTGTVVIQRGAVTEAISSLEFTRASGDVLDLEIEDWALAQQGEPTLKRIVFPEGLDTLTVGASAAYQYSPAGSATLAEVVFPRDLFTLDIGQSAFRQDVREAAALRTVTFPDQLRELTVGAQAFRQKYGTAGGLESVNLPGGLQRLDIGLRAFSLSPSYRAGESLRSVHLGFGTRSAATAVTLGAELTDAGSPLHPDASSWLWTGAKSTVQAAFGSHLEAPDALRSEPLGHGYPLRFDDGTSGELRAARSVPSDTGFVPMAGDEGEWQQSVPTVQPQRPSYRFLGWSTVRDGKVEFAPGDRVTKPADAESVTLYAVWKKNGNGNGHGKQG